jgi:hypothetical protein
MCLHPDFEEYLKTVGEVCRKYLTHITMELQSGCVSLRNQEDRCTYHSVIEAASFLRGRLFRSHSTDARHTADQKLLRTTRGMLQTYGPNSSITHLKQAELDQVHSFLIEPAEFELVGHMSNNAAIAVYGGTAASIHSRSFNDGTLTANTDTSLHTSFKDDPVSLYSAISERFEPLAPHGFSAQSQTFPSDFPQQTASLQFLPSTQAYEGPFLRPIQADAYPPMSLDWLDTRQQYDLTGQLYSGTSLATPPTWDVDTVTSTPLMLPRYQRSIDAATMPEVLRYPNNDPIALRRNSENAKRSPVRREARQRRRPPMPAPPVLTASTAQTGFALDVFVDHPSVPKSNSPRKRQKIAQDGGAETAQVEYRFQRPVEARGKSREKLLRESIGRHDTG